MSDVRKLAETEALYFEAVRCVRAARDDAMRESLALKEQQEVTRAAIKELEEWCERAERAALLVAEGRERWADRSVESAEPC